MWRTIGYNSRSHLVYIARNLNNDHCIKEIVEPEVLPFFDAFRILYFNRIMPVHMFHCTTDFSFSIVCLFSRYVYHRVCLGVYWLESRSYNWCATQKDWTLISSWSHLNCHSPGLHLEPVLFNTTMRTGSHRSAWRMLKSVISNFIVCLFILSCRFDPLFIPLSVIRGINFINFWKFLQSIAIFTNMSIIWT